MASFATLLTNTKTRTLIVAISTILVAGVGVALTRGEDESKEEVAESRSAEVPRQVRSTPGANISQKHRKLLEASNKAGAQKASTEGGAFVPTISGNNSNFADNNFASQFANEFEDLSSACTPDNVDELKAKGMSVAQILIKLKDEGCSAEQLSKLFSAEELAAALGEMSKCAPSGCDVTAVNKLKKEGLDLDAIAIKLKENQCSPEDTLKALKDAGYKLEDIISAMRKAGFTVEDVAKAMLASGISPSEVAKALKAAGVSVEEIASVLKSAGLDAKTIAKAMLDSGYSRAEIATALNEAGFDPVEVVAATTSLDDDSGLASALKAEQERKAREAELARRQRALEEAQQLARYGNQRKDAVGQLTQAMQDKAGTMIEDWENFTTQTFVQGNWSDPEFASEQLANRSVVGANGELNSGDASAGPEVILKAGKLLFAVLDTAVNSDEPGPILATVVSEPLKGAKLMGTMRPNYESGQISMTFDTINIPYEAKSMGISASAIDPDTARTALATEVDRHYLLRWGALFSSAFMEAYASSIATAGESSVTTSGAAGTTTVSTSAAEDGRKNLFKGLASIGSKFSEVAAEKFDKKATITIDQGTSVGLLLTADLVYGTEVGNKNTDPSDPINEKIINPENFAFPKDATNGDVLAALNSFVAGSGSANAGDENGK